MKHDVILGESLLNEVTNGQATGPDAVYQIVDRKTGHPVGKPTRDKVAAGRRASKLSGENGNARYVIRQYRNLDELDRADLELIRQDDEKKKAAADRTRTRDEFRDKMRSREGQGIQAGDRVYSKKKDKMYAVRRVTPDGILFKGLDEPVKMNVKNTGRKTNLGHRVFVTASAY